MQHGSVGVDQSAVGVAGVHGILQLPDSSLCVSSHQQTLHRLLQHVGPQDTQHSTELQGGGA